jgi:hypothetical protein
MTKQKQEMTSVERTSGGLRDAIFDELDAIRNGNSNPTRANAVAKLAGSIVETVRMEIEVQKYARTVDDKKPMANAPLGESLRLGA